MAQTDRLQTEQEHQKRAFAHYAAQQGRRSYRATAEAFGVSVSTVKLWSKSFSWRQRLREEDTETARQTADRMLVSPPRDGARNRKIVQMAVVKLAKGIADGTVKMQLGDLDRLLRLQTFLEDHPVSDDFEGMIPQQFALVLYERHTVLLEYFLQQPREWTDAVVQFLRGAGGGEGEKFSPLFGRPAARSLEEDTEDSEHA